MAIDTGDIHHRIVQLEDSDKRLTHELMSINNRLDKSLLSLTMNVSSLTDAIKSLQESNLKTVELQQKMLLMQERTSLFPEMQKKLHEFEVSQARNDVVLRGIRLVAVAMATTVIGIIVTALWGFPIK